MDTRTKIVTPAAVATLDLPRPVLLVTGRFDILRVDVARELTAARERTGAQSLIVAIGPYTGELVPLEARAEMAAALRVVDYVFIAEDRDLAGLITALQPIETIHLEEAETHRVGQLIEHVHGR